MDQESRDANSLLVELDRGLQSPNIGEQSEAVARFTNLFQRFPLPILIDSACLKLSEAFKLGSNFIRVQICEVFERNQSHLNKIYSIEPFYRNIFTVTTSNDPIARSITLLTLGNIAPIVSGYKTIHHCISDSLESSVESELNAAIACAASFVKQSSEFACNIYPKIVSIIDSSKSTTDIKIRALSVLDHSFYNANDAMTVRSFLIDVIGKSELKKLICTCLTLSTKIAYSSLSHIMPQIELLLKIFSEEMHLIVKLNALRNLKFLAEKSPHIWESSHVDPLISYLETDLNESNIEIHDRYLGIILSIFCKLLTCKCNFIAPVDKTRIFQHCYKLALNNQNMLLCTMAFELLTVMSEEHCSHSTKNMIEYQSSEPTPDTFIAIKSFLLTATKSMTPKAAKLESKKASQRMKTASSSTKIIYKHIVKLCQLNPHYSADVINLIFNRLNDTKVSLKDLSPYVTELMCAVHQSTRESVITPDNCWRLIKTKSSDMSKTNLLNLCVLYFQILRLNSTQDAADGLVDKITDDQNLWFGFKVMRQAMRYGHHKIAGNICQKLHEHVTNDTTDFYFKSLGRICAAETILLQGKDLDLNLKMTLPLYEDSVSPLRASIGNSRTTNFQLQFIWLRIRNLQAHGTLRQCCKIYEASPITYTTLLSGIGATRGGGDLGKLGALQQMPKIAKDFRYLADCYANLAAVSFDCDNPTLDYINLLKCSCLIMADSIDAIFQYGKNLPIVSKISLSCMESELALEHRDLEETCNRLIEMIRSEIIKPGIFPSPKTIEPLVNLLKTLSSEILSSRFMYPRYFFQPLQITQTKLAITPPTSKPAVLYLNNNLVLKVEGLIENLSKTQKVIREVSKVLISVAMSSASNAPVDSNLNIFVQSTATPQNNYFKTEFLLHMKWIGQFNVDICVSIIDEQERVWKTGPTERLNITVS